MTTNPLFQLTDVWLQRSNENGHVQTILRGVNAAIAGAGITCLVGPSGSGKSTLLRLLNRLEDPNRGVIRFQGEEITSLDPLQLRREVGLVLQTPVMLPGSVRDNLEAGLRIRGRKLESPDSWLDRVGLLPTMLQRDARDLSGGEKQRVALARTLATNPRVLLLDEITASLDPESASSIEELVHGLNLPAVWVSHSPEQVKRVASRVLRLEAGHLQEVAP